MTRTSFLLTGLALGLGLSCQPPLTPSVQRLAVLVIAVDVSTSTNSPGHSITDLKCPEVVAATEEALTTAGLRRLDILVLASGSSKSTSYEARVAIPWRSFSPASRLFGKKVTAADQREQFLRELDKDCQSSLQEEPSSPIFFTVERALLSLSNHAQELSSGREVKVSRSLVVLTDLRENVHAGIRTRLVSVSEALRRGKPIPARPATLPVLSAQGTTIRVCGLSGFRSTGSPDDLILPAAVPVVWREVLPDATFDAACSTGRWGTSSKAPDGGAP